MPAQLQEAYTRAVGRFLVAHGIEFVAVGEWANKMFEGMPEVQRLQCGTIKHPSYFQKGSATTEDFEDLQISLGNIFSKVLDEEVPGPDMTRRARRGNSIWEGADELLSAFGMFRQDQGIPLRLIPDQKMSKLMEMKVDGGDADEAVQGMVVAAYKDVCRDGGRKGGRNNPNAWINDMQFESLVQVRFLLTFPPKLYTNTRLALPRSVLLLSLIHI